MTARLRSPTLAGPEAPWKPPLRVHEVETVLDNDQPRLALNMGHVFVRIALALSGDCLWEVLGQCNDARDSTFAWTNDQLPIRLLNAERSSRLVPSLKPLPLRRSGK